MLFEKTIRAIALLLEGNINLLDRLKEYVDSTDASDRFNVVNDMLEKWCVKLSKWNLHWRERQCY